MSLGRAKLFFFCTVGLAEAAHAQPTKLDRFIGKDLREDPSEQQSLENIIGVAHDIFGPTPWDVWKTNRNGRTRYIVLLVQSEMSIPGDSSACILLFDAGATKIGNWCFPTGHRITPASASIEFSNEAGSDLIVITMQRLINGRDVAREYFGLNDDRPRLVRLENDNGEAARNDYVSSSSEIGPVPDAITVEEWASMLESEDKTVLLSALTVLGEWRAERFHEVLGSARIRELIKDLAESENSWVWQAAEIIAGGPRERRPR
jgi:hypothetical protein